MYQPITFFIACRYLFGKGLDRFGRLISVLSTVGIILGVSALIIVLSVMNGLENQIQKSTLSYIPQVVVSTSQGKLDPARYPASSLSHLQGVTRITPLIRGDVILQSQHGIALSRLIGLDPTEHDAIADRVIGDSVPQLVSGHYQIVIGRKLASQLNVGIGESVRLMATNTSLFTPVGRVPSQRLFTVAGIFYSDPSIETEQIYVHQDDAAKLMQMRGQLSGWRLYLSAPLTVARFERQALPETLIFSDWRAQKGELFQAISIEKSMMGLLIGLIIMVAAFNIITSLGLVVMEKQAEIAILQSQGLTRTKLVIIFILQGMSTSIIGTIIGVIMGSVVACYLNEIRTFLGLATDFMLPVMMVPNQLILLSLFSLGIAFFSTLYPVWQAVKIQPAEALRYE